MRKVNFFDGAQSSTVPTIGNLVASNLVQYANDAAYEAGEVGAPTAGNVYYNTTDNVVRYYNGSSWLTIEDENITATDVEYDNTSSALIATDTQTAIDEVEARVDQNESDIANNIQDIADTKSALGLLDSETNMGAYTGSFLTDNTDQKSLNQEIETEVDSKIDSSEKGAANGVATLDGSGKIPSGQLPASVMQYQGAFDANTGSPALSNGVGDTGDVYRVTIAGSYDFGSGSISFDVGDWVAYNGTIWEKQDNIDQVTSVNGKQGAVVLDPDDLDDTSTTNKFNQTHSGDAAGATTLTLQPAAITGKTTETPESGDFVLFSDTSDSNNLKKADIADLLGGGSGQGGINHIINHSFEDNDDGWSAYADSAASEPSDGTGGLPTSVFERTINASEIIRGTASGEFRKPNGTNEQGEGFSYDFAIDPADENKQLNISFEYFTSGALYTSGDLKVFIYDIDNTILLGSIENDDNGDILVSDKITRFQGTFETTDSSNYRLIFHVTTTTTSGFQINIDNVKVGPFEFAPGFIGKKTEVSTLGFDDIIKGNTTDPVFDATPEKNFISITRVGNEAIFRGFYYHSTGTGTSAGSGAYYVDLSQFGLQIDLNLFDQQSNRSAFGFAHVQTTSGQFNGECSLRDATGVYLRASISSTDPRTANISNTTHPVANTEYALDFEFTVPIDGWEATNLISTNEINLMTNNVLATRTSNLTINTIETDIIFNSAVIDPHNSFNPSTGVFTAKRRGRYLALSNLRIDTGVSAATQHTLRFYQNTTPTIVGAESDLNASKAYNYNPKYIFFLEKNDTIKMTATAATNSSTLIGTQASLIIIELPDFTNFGVYGEYEVLDVESATKTPTASGNWQNMTGNSLTLTPGTWRLTGKVTFNFSGGSVDYGIIQALWASNDGADNSTQPTALTLDHGPNLTGFQDSGSTHDRMEIVMSPAIYTVSSEENIFLTAFANMTTFANSRITCSLTAERLK